MSDKLGGVHGKYFYFFSDATTEFTPSRNIARRFAIERSNEMYNQYFKELES